MDFTISKAVFDRGLRQMLQGRKQDDTEPVDITVAPESLRLVVTGRSTELPIQAAEVGCASVPLATLFGIRRMAKTFAEESYRIRISAGRMRLQSASISNPAITLKVMASRMIDMPDDARPIDLVALPFCFDASEIEESGLLGRVLAAQKHLADNVDSAAHWLGQYGVTRQELLLLTKEKIEAYAPQLKYAALRRDDDGER